MNGPSGVLALVLAETAVGAAGVSWLAPLWGSVRRGFFVLTGLVAGTCAALAALAAGGEGGAPRAAVLLAAATAIALGLSAAALVARFDAAGRVLGLASVPVGAAMLVALAGAAGPSFPLALFQLAAGALFMGAVTAGLLLGHWYLTDRRLPRDHIRRLSSLLVGAVALEGVAIAAGGFSHPVAVGAGFNPLLSVAGVASWLALGMAAATAMVAVLIRASLRGSSPRAVQAATGFFYLAVITAFAAEMAAKLRFIG